jgi:hypothetical protein
MGDVVVKVRAFGFLLDFSWRFLRIFMREPNYSYAKLLMKFCRNVEGLKKAAL